MRLTGWQRIGVVVSGLWLPVGGVWGNNVGLDQGEFALGILDSCTDKTEVCMVHFNRVYDAATRDHWLYALCYAVIPLVFLWCLAWLAVVAYRWIHAGFLRSKTIMPSPRNRAAELVSAKERQALRLGALMHARNTGKSSKEVIFVTHSLILCSLPYSPTNEHSIVRKARLGDGTTLRVTFSCGIEGIRLPYGSDRKLLFWIMDRAWRCKSREIAWESAREYQREMGMSYGGRSNRDLQASFRRLAGLAINIERANAVSVWGANRCIIESYHLPNSISGFDDANQMCLTGIPAHKNYMIRINELLFEDMKAIPYLLWNHAKLVDAKRGQRGVGSARVHDLLMFLFVRCYAAQSKSVIPWSSLSDQVSTDSNPRRLKSQACEAINFLKQFWPGCQIEPDVDGIHVNRATSPPHPDDPFVNRLRRH